ncbi:exonuclease domain-containing protein [Azospirillum doebereinerae]
MMGGAWRVAMVGLAVAAAALTFLGAEIAWMTGNNQAAYIQDMAVAAVGLLALWAAFASLSRHFRDLGRLRDTLSGLPGRAAAFPSRGRNDEVGQLAQAATRSFRPDRVMPGRLEKSVSAMLSLADSPTLLLNDHGRIERLNPAAARLLDTEEGADIGQSLVRADLLRAIERARGGDAVSAVLRRPDDTELSARIADLGLNAGVVLAFSGRNAAGPAGMGKHTLSLRPAPPTEPLGDDDPLAALPFVALWVATAGAEPGEGPVVAVGTMRLAGARVFRTVSLSVLIDPATPVTAEAAARHGITTETVAGARPFAEVWPAIQEALHHCVVVGVGVDAALAALARACAHADLPDPALPPSLDLGALAGALDPELAGATLDRLVEAFQLTPGTGPFAAALHQAELAARLLVQLDQRGIATHGQARALLAGGAAPAA